MPDGDVADDENAVSGDAQDPQRLQVPGFGPRSDAALPAVIEKPARPTVRNMVMVLGGVVLAAIVIIVLVGWLVLSVLNHTVGNVQDRHDQTAITPKQFKATELGSSEAKVREQLGEPTGTTDGGDSGSVTKCLYYNEMGAGIGDDARFKFCFTGGQLVRKLRD